MINSKNYSATQSRGTSIVAFFFLMIALFLLTGFLPQYLNDRDTDGIELSENMEDGSEEEKNEKETEKETDKYQSELMQYALFSSGSMMASDGHFHKWQNPSADIITPPPDLHYS